MLINLKLLPETDSNYGKINKNTYYYSAATNEPGHLEEN